MNVRMKNKDDKFMYEQTNDELTCRTLCNWIGTQLDPRLRRLRLQVLYFLSWVPSLYPLFTTFWMLRKLSSREL